MYKNIFSLIAVTFLFTPQLFADEYPSYWHLPQKGENCFLDTVIPNDKWSKKCGDKRYEIWTCATRGEEDAPAQKNQFLLIGKMISDTDDENCDTYSVDEVLSDEYIRLF